MPLEETKVTNQPGMFPLISQHAPRYVEAAEAEAAGPAWLLGLNAVGRHQTIRDPTCDLSACPTSRRGYWSEMEGPARLRDFDAVGSHQAALHFFCDLSACPTSRRGWRSLGAEPARPRGLDAAERHQTARVSLCDRMEEYGGGTARVAPGFACGWNIPSSPTFSL